MALLFAEREQMKDDIPTEHPQIISHHKIFSDHTASLQWVGKVHTFCDVKKKKKNKIERNQVRTLL